MALPSLPKKEPRPVPVTVRLSKRAADQLKTLAKEHNMSQADVMEHLLQTEFQVWQARELNPIKKGRQG
jgi:hypothetical protein